MGPQNMGERPMKSWYRALDKLITVPLVLYVAATSGTAARTVVELTGARKEQKERTVTMMIFRWEGNLS